MFILNLFRDSDRAVTYEPGHVIFSEGDPGNEMYVVIEGEAEVRIHDKVVETAGPGGIVGELSIIDDTPRSATFVAKTACKVVPIDKRQFNYMTQETPFFAITVMRVMADRLRHRSSV